MRFYFSFVPRPKARAKIYEAAADRITNGSSIGLCGAIEYAQQRGRLRADVFPEFDLLFPPRRTLLPPGQRQHWDEQPCLSGAYWLPFGDSETRLTFLAMMRSIALASKD